MKTASTPSTTVFARYPAALSLPCADPSGLAVEVMLRFAGVHATRRDARLGDLSLTIHDTDGCEAPSSSSAPAAAAADPPPPTGSAKTASSPTEVCSGLMSCLTRLSGESGIAQLSDAATTEATCVEVLTQQCIFPAFLFAMHLDPMVYKAAMAKSVEPKVASFWEGITGSYRAHVLRGNPFFYTGRPLSSVPSGRLSLEHLAKLREVGGDVDRAFAALESMCVAKAATSADMFFLGTSKPTHVDALVYAAASCFFHADVGATGAVVKAHQQRLMKACPHLLQYAERLRHQFFEADSGTYCLKPHGSTEEDPATAVVAAAEQQYRRGRLQTLWWTGVFATVYFVLSNADMVVALLQETLEEEEEELAAAEAATSAEAHGQDAGSAAHREPREL